MFMSVILQQSVAHFSHAVRHALQASIQAWYFSVETIEAIAIRHFPFHKVLHSAKSLPDMVLNMYLWFVILNL